MTRLAIRVALAALLTGLFVALMAALDSRAQARGFDWFFAHVPPSGQCAGREIAVSFYQTGRRTANGEAFDANGNTAASRGRVHGGFNIGERVTLTNPRTGQTLTVRVNDRGPYGPAHRLGVKLDLARGAALRLGLRQSGWLCVRHANDGDRP